MSSNCRNFKRIVMEQILGPYEDDVGLFEQYWQLKSGPHNNTQLNLSKEIELKELINLNKMLISKGYFYLYYKSTNSFFRVLELNYLDEIENWKPFSIENGPGYILRSTKKSDLLVSKYISTRGSFDF